MLNILLDMAFAPFTAEWWHSDLVVIPAGVLLFCAGFSLIRMLINLFWSR